jgi:metal-sulfur cluster biosynthetic enzyme
MPYDQATDILTTIECVLADNLRPAVEELHRSAQITDAELEVQYREWQTRRLDP